MKTKKIKTAAAVPGMKVTEDIYSFSDQMIITKGTILTDRIITRLKFYAIAEIPIEESEATADNTYIIHPEDYYIARVRESESFQRFSISFASSLVNSRIKINNFLHKKMPFDKDALIADVYHVLESCQNPTNVMDMLHCMRELDDVTFIHGLNVALIAATLGSWLKYPETMLQELMLAGLLHDIGKLTIPQDLLTKTEKLTDDEYSQLKAHAMNGYNLIKALPISQHVKYTAMMHHERCDGSGYPLGLIGGQIDSYAKIIAIADVYDAMTSARVYRGAICPFDVIRQFESEGLHKFDTHFMMTFLEGIVQVYLERTVRLSDGRVGEIIMINKTALSRPVVRVKDGFIDLAKEPLLYIEALV